MDRVMTGTGLAGWDLVLIARTETLKRDFSAMAREFADAVAKVTRTA